MAMTTGTMAGALHAGAVGMGMGVGELGGGKRGTTIGIGIRICTRVHIGSSPSCSQLGRHRGAQGAKNTTKSWWTTSRSRASCAAGMALPRARSLRRLVDSSPILQDSDLALSMFRSATKAY
jgi:hypothetical protein